MYPVVIGNGRQTTSDSIIKGYHIPKGVSYNFKNIIFSIMCNYGTQLKEEI